MGDLPEPQYDSTILTTKDNTPVMNKIYDTIGRSRAKKAAELARLQQDKTPSVRS